LPLFTWGSGVDCTFVLYESGDGGYKFKVTNRKAEKITVEYDRNGRLNPEEREFRLFVQKGIILKLPDGNYIVEDNAGATKYSFSPGDIQNKTEKYKQAMEQARKKYKLKQLIDAGEVVLELLVYGKEQMYSFKDDTSKILYTKEELLAELAKRENRATQSPPASAQASALPAEELIESLGPYIRNGTVKELRDAGGRVIRYYLSPQEMDTRARQYILPDDPEGLAQLLKAAQGESAFSAAVDATDTLKKIAAAIDRYRAFQLSLADPDNTGQNRRLKELAGGIVRDILSDLHKLGVSQEDLTIEARTQNNSMSILGIKNDDWLWHSNRMLDLLSGAKKRLEDKYHISVGSPDTSSVYTKRAQASGSASSAAESIVGTVPQKRGQSPEINTGGIDFRALPIVIQAMSNLSAALRNNPLRGQPLITVNLSKELGEIERLVEAGITPSAERIREYLQASCAKGEVENDVAKVVSCISDILRLEEERCCATEAMLKDILVMLESGRPAQELKAVFLGTKL
jgi:hypothetical protein